MGHGFILLWVLVQFFSGTIAVRVALVAILSHNSSIVRV